MTKKQKRITAEAAAGALLLILAVFLPEGAVKTAVYIAAYIASGSRVIIKAVKNIAHGQIFDENFLMGIASLGAMAIGDYKEGTAVMIFYLVGELFESYAVGRSRRSIASLMDIRPEYAVVKRNGEEIRVDPNEVDIGEVIVVSPGDKIPLDGKVISGYSSVDTSAITGESVPRDVACGDSAVSGCVNISGVIELEVTKRFGESTVSKILDMVENAASKKAPAENFITKFAKYYTPCVVAAALLVAIIPPLVFSGRWSEWIYRALTFLVISCPCALVISVPLGFFGGIGGASRHGILVKGSNYLEVISKTSVMAFDKTGTLTKGNFSVSEVHVSDKSALGGFCSDNINPETALVEIAARAESYSNHPIALSLKKACKRDISGYEVINVKQTAGRGVYAEVDGKRLYVGNSLMMSDCGIITEAVSHNGTVVHVAVNEKYAGYIIISDEIKENSVKAVKGLRNSGIKKLVMLSGDNKNTAEYVGKTLGLDEVYSELLPDDKVKKLEEMQSGSDSGTLAYVGDGINDAPVLTRADVGIAMGGIGADAAIEAADVVIMDDNPERLITAINIAKGTVRIVRQNIVFALAVKAAVLVLGALGIANMWMAVFADVGVSVLAILNSVRAMSIK